MWPLVGEPSTSVAAWTLETDLIGYKKNRYMNLGKFANVTEVLVDLGEQRLNMIKVYCVHI